MPAYAAASSARSRGSAAAGSAPTSSTASSARRHHAYRIAARSRVGAGSSRLASAKLFEWCASTARAIVAGDPGRSASAAPSGAATAVTASLR